MSIPTAIFLAISILSVLITVIALTYHCAVRDERKRIAARLRRQAGYHSEFTLTHRTNRELVLGMAKAIEDGAE